MAAMTYAQEVRDLINAHQARQATIWKQVVAHSNAYCAALNLTRDDLEILRDVQPMPEMPSVHDLAQYGFWSLMASEQRFVLASCASVGPDGGWMPLVLAICTSAPALNEAVGHGPSLLTRIDPQWHDLLVAALKG